MAAEVTGVLVLVSDMSTDSDGPFRFPGEHSEDIRSGLTRPVSSGGKAEPRRTPSDEKDVPVDPLSRRARPRS